MNKILQEKIENHFSHDDFLEKKDLEEILKIYPELEYKGKAYRLLLFSNPTKEQSLENDSSFSYSLQGIKYYYNKQDIDYYKYAQIYEVSLRGLNFEKLVLKLNLKNKEMAQKECEIILIDLFDQQLLINDKNDKVDLFLNSF